MNIWMDAGQSSSNTRRYVHIPNLSQHLGPITCNALPGFHALTGSDDTSSFLRKRKVNRLKLAEKCPLHLEGLGNIAESKHLSDCDHLIESYVCAMYEQHKAESVNEARYNIFMQKYKPVSTFSALAKIQGIDAGVMPLYQKVLKLDHCNYVAYMWKHLHLADPMCSMDLTEHGWKEDNGMLKPIWCHGPQLPGITD